MKIIIKTKNIKLTPTLQNFIVERMNSLERFAESFFSEDYYDHFFGKGKPKIEAWVEVGSESRHHQKGAFFAECQLRFPGKSIRSVAQADNLGQAITEIKDELQRTIKQYKEKISSRAKRKLRVLKKDLKLSPLARFYRKGRIREEGI